MVPNKLLSSLGAEARQGSGDVRRPLSRGPGRFRRLAFLILMLYLPGSLSGCALFRRTIEQACDPQRVLDTLDQRSDRLTSFVGQGEVVLNSFGTEHRAKIFIALLKPGYIMLKLFAPSGTPLMVFLVRNGVLSSYDFQEKLITEEKLNDGVIRLDVGVEIPITQFVAACTGNIEPIDFDQISCRRREREDLTSLVLRFGILKERVQYIRLGSRDLRAESVELRRDGKIESSVSFTYPKGAKKTLIPKTVFIELPRVPASIRIKYDQTSINAKLLPEHFRVDVPRGWRIEDDSS
ncbi:MAG: hypothetical protein HY788_24075 [Deltaproteobacteria bacterium]|nr:hypothetical protein [Deltaproteobacteria bacterium]